MVPGASIGRVAITSWGAGQSIVFKITYRIFFKEERFSVLIGLRCFGERIRTQLRDAIAAKAGITQRRRVRRDGAEAPGRKTLSILF